MRHLEGLVPPFVPVSHQFAHHGLAAGRGSPIPGPVEDPTSLESGVDPDKGRGGSFSDYFVVKLEIIENRLIPLTITITMSVIVIPSVW